MSIDAMIGRADRILRAAFAVPPRAPRPMPGHEAGPGADAAAPDDAALTEDERRHAAGLMRVNHAGEVSAQALYVGQSLGSRTAEIRRLMDRSADEEFDHLRWCRRRLEELDARPSRLDPLWFGGAFAMGVAAGALGDRVSLGFLAETERQVVAHLDEHLARLPAGDARSRAILTAMKRDETHHANTAVAHGALEFPAPVRRGMQAISRLMTRSAYWV